MDCSCGATFRPSDWYWTCQGCCKTGGRVRPVRRIAVKLEEWKGKGHWDRDAREFRERTLATARAWAKRMTGTVIIGVERRPELKIATIEALR